MAKYNSNFSSIIDIYNSVLCSRPDAICLVSGNTNISFRYFDALANRFAFYLKKYGVKFGDVIGISIHNCVELPILVVSIMKCGASFCLIDPDFPLARIEAICKDSNCKICIVDNEVMKGGIFLHISKLKNANSSKRLLHFTFAPSDVAYFVYTSGSTGTPKGIMIDHRAIKNYCQYIDKTYKIENKRSHFALFSSISFDLTLTSLVFPICFGEVLHIFDNRDDVHNLLRDLVNDCSITHLKLTPAHLAMILEIEIQKRSPIRFMIVGGDQLQSLVAKQISIKFDRKVEIINEYGPSETTIGVSYDFFDENDDSVVVSIGKPIPNVNLYLKNDHVEVEESLYEGEILISGDSVGLGYWNKPRLTAQKFLPSQFGKRHYCTGDLGKVGKDGDLYCLGRMDRQVKINGYRIEIDEIDSILRKNRNVKDCLIAVYDVDSKEFFYQNALRPVLVAFVVEANNAKHDYNYEDYLKEYLPSYMLPKIFRKVSKIPLTKYGKTDYKKLSRFMLVAKENQEKMSDLQQRIAQIWAETLKLDAKTINLDSNFFQLGGDSITAIGIENRCRPFFKMSVRDLFRYPTIRGLVDNVYQKLSLVENDKFSLKLESTLIQQWFFKNINRNAFPQVVCLMFDKNIVIDDLKRILKSIIKNHQVFDYLFSISKRGEISLETSDRVQNVFLWDKSKVDGDLDDRIVLRNINELSHKLNFSKGPILAARILENKEKNLLVLIIHHLYIDAISWRILLKELDEKLRNDSSGKTEKIGYYTWNSKLTVDYKSRASVEQYLGDFYKKCRLAHQEIKCRATGKSKSISVTLLSSGLNLLKSFVNENMYGDMEAFFLAFISKAVCTTFGKKNIVVQIEDNGRDILSDYDLSSTVGWLTSLYPFFFEDSSDFCEMLRQCRQQLSEIPKLPFGCISSENDSGNASNCVKPDVLFNYLGNVFLGSYESFSLYPIVYNFHTNLYPLEVNIYISDNQLNMILSYDKTLSDKCAYFVNVLSKMLKNFLERAPSLSLQKIPGDIINDGLSIADFDKIATYFPNGNINSIKAVYSLNTLQRDILFFEEFLSSNSRDYCQEIEITLNGKLDYSLMKEVFRVLATEYEALNSCFLYEGLSEPKQVIVNTTKGCLYDNEFEFYSGFVPKEGSLFRVFIKNNEQNDDYTLIWKFHHIILDGWSVLILFRRFLEMVECFTKNQNISENKKTSLIHYKRLIKQASKKEAISYWKDFFQNSDDIRQDLSISVESNNDEGSEKNSVHFYLSEDLTAKLEIFCHENGLTISSLLLGVWGIVMCDCCSVEQAFFGTVISGRSFTDDLDSVGVFINTIPLRVDKRRAGSILEYLLEIQRQLKESEEHSCISFGEIQNISPQKNNLINTLVVVENYPLINEIDKLFKKYELPFSLKSINVQEETHYDICVTFVPSQTLMCEIQFVVSKYGKEFINNLENSIINICEQILYKSSVYELNVFASNEQKLISFAKGAKKNLIESTLCKLFLKDFKSYKDRIAILQEGQFISYEYLDYVSNQLIVSLSKLGINYKDKVCIVAGKCVDKAFAWLAVVKMGVCYIPIDADTSFEQILHIVKQSGAKLILTLRKYTKNWNTDNLPMMYLDDVNLLYRPSFERKMRVPKVNDLPMYVIFTSGSTGKPKGVLVSQKSVINHYIWMKDKLNLNSMDRMMQFLSFGADTAVTELYVLLVGGTLCFLDEQLYYDLSYISEYSRKHRVTIMQMIPSLLKLIADGGHILSSSLKYVICGAEVLAQSVVSEWNIKEKVPILNLYGLTEVSIDSTCYECLNSTALDIDVPIGKPINNNNVYVLSKNFFMSNIDVRGEMYIGGYGVAIGYLGQPKITAKCFVPDIFEYGKRMYRTGDIASYRSDGNIDFFGRKDRQVKINGFRLELSEMEIILQSFPGVRQAALKLFHNNNVGNVLCAYYESVSKISPKELREYLKKHYKAALLPAHFIFMKEIPHLTNGKVAYDELSLPCEMEKLANCSSNSIENQIQEIWGGILNVSADTIPLDVSFFDVGGNSISLIKMQSAINSKFSLNVSISDLFSFYSISMLGEFIENIKANSVSNTGSNEG